MKKLLWVPILLLPIVAVVWSSLASWSSHVSGQEVAVNSGVLSELELVALDHPALAKVAADSIGRYQAMNHGWQEVVHTYKVLALVLLAMIMILAFIAGVLMLKKSPNAFNSDAPNRLAG